MRQSTARERTREVGSTCEQLLMQRRAGLYTQLLKLSAIARFRTSWNNTTAETVRESQRQMIPPACQHWLQANDQREEERRGERERERARERERERERERKRGDAPKRGAQKTKLVFLVACWRRIHHSTRLGALITLVYAALLSVANSLRGSDGWGPSATTAPTALCSHCRWLDLGQY